jgi:hypothetical protein
LACIDFGPRHGTVVSENWQEGAAFQQLAQRQKIFQEQKEAYEKAKKQLSLKIKKRSFAGTFFVLSFVLLLLLLFLLFFLILTFSSTSFAFHLQ